MAQPPPRQRGSGQHSGAFAFEAKLENEEQVLDALLASMARGPLPDGVWEKLHAAAQRDERLSELAFGFESASQGKRLKTVPPAVGAEFLFQGARFLGDVFGDEVGAISYLERALALVPAHAGAFAKIEQLLRKAGQTRKLADVYAAAAQHRPRGEQAPLLKQAADLLAETGGADEKLVELLQQVLRLEPGDEPSRERLEALYLKTNRIRDVVRLNEQALAAEPERDEATRKRLLERIVELYEAKLHEPERAMPHVEQLLALDPTNEQARKVAQKLVVIKGLAGRAAAALSTAYEVLGTPQDIVRWLTIELENTRGPKRANLLTRLGTLKMERMGDDKGAVEAFEQALTIDGSDDALRARYVALATKLSRFVDAAKALQRLLATIKDGAIKAKASAQLGEMLLRGGDARRAKATLAGVLAAADAPADASLAAARLLREILETEKDARALSDVLERLASLEPDAELRRDVDERLAVLASLLKDTPRAIAAYERLLPTVARAKALAALAPLYEASGDPDKHARLLEEQAKDAADGPVARELMMRAARVRIEQGKDPAAAIAACRAVVQRFGPARDVLALLGPLLEGQRMWAELVEAVDQEASVSAGTEQAALLARLGMLRMQRLRDARGAIDAFERALAVDPAEKTARTTLEKLAAVGDQRLAAAHVLEPVYRREGATGPLLKLLELRGSLAEDIDDRLGALREAAELAAGAGASESSRAAETAGRGLAEAAAGQRPFQEWLDRLDRVAGPGTDPKRRALLLGRAIGTREVTSPELSTLAKKAGEAHAASGDAPAAIELYRRALAFEPQSSELLSRIDDLLRDQGSPRERVALYRAALEQASAARRKELLHRIGVVERHDLDDLPAAILTYRLAIADDEDDADAYAALGDLYAQAGRWEELCALLEGRLARVEGDAARAIRARLAEVASQQGDPERARAQCARLLEDPALGPEHLDAVERAAEHLGDADVARAVLHRRAEMTQDPREQIAWLDRLGELDEQRRGDLESAAGAWKRAAALAETTGDDETARRLWGRARKIAPEDREVTARLTALCERAELWAELPRLYASLGTQAADDAERVELWLRTASVLSERLGDVEAAARRAALAFETAPSRPDVLATFERLAIEASMLDSFEHAVDEALTRVEGSRSFEPEQRALLLLARARALSADPKRADEATRAYRDILADARIDRAHQVAALSAFEALVRADAQSPARRADRRWLLEWRAEHAPEEERVARLLEWAREEEGLFGEAQRALVLHRRVLALDAESDEARAAVARLALATGDAEEAIEALRARRDRAEGPARNAIELEIAHVLLERTTRWTEALESLRAVLAESPSDATARGLAAQLLAHRATRAGAVAMLEQACDASEDPDARAQILVRLLDAPADADDAAARQGWFERLCDLQRERGDVEGALATAVRAAREMPHVPPLWDRAEELTRALTRPDDVAALYEEVLARPLERAPALRIGERAVQFYEEWFEDSARVVRVLERVLEIDPTADWAFDRLKLLLDAAERWDDLFALYDRALDSAPEAKRATLLEDAAQTAKDFADRPDRAIGYLEQLRELSPDDPKLASSLERLYERQGRHRELVALLEARLPGVKREEARRTRVRVAGLWLDELGDPGAALEAIEPILLRPDDVTNGTSDDVWGLLERVLAAAPPTPEPRRSTMPPPSTDAPRARRSRKSEPPSSSRGSVRQRAAVWLHEHYARNGRDADLARVMLVELEAVKSGKERVKRHAQIAELYEKLGDLVNALEQTGLAFVLDPAAEARRTALVDLAERTGRLERLADLLAAAADAADGQALRVALTMQAATVRADRIGDAAGAIALLTSVLAARRVPDADVLAAARRLEPLLEAAGRDAERLDVVERIASVQPEPTERREALGRAATLAGRLGQNERAVTLWELRLAEDAGDMAALDGLVTLLESEVRLARLTEVLDLRARAATSDDRRRADRVRIARLLGSELERPRDAIQAWRDVERDFGETDDVALALAVLLRATGRWQELAELLERGAARTADDATRAELLRQLGDVQREQLGTSDAAVTTYGLALAADPRNAGARAGLLALAADEAQRAQAVRVLLGGLRACDDWQAILELTAHRLLAAATDDDRRAVLLEASALGEQRAGDPGLAFEAMRRAFSLEPGDEHVGAELERLAGAAGAWQGLVDGYREAIDGSGRTDAALTARLRARMGATLETRLDDLRAALAEYLHVVAGASDREAGRAAVRVAGRLGEWDVAARVVIDLSQAGEAPPELLAAYELAAGDASAWDAAMRALETAAAAGTLADRAARDIEARAAVWHRDRRGDPRAAEAAFVRALAHDASDASLLAPLVELQRVARERPLVDSLLRLSRATGGDLTLLREAAEVARDSVGDRSLARGVMRELLDLARLRWSRSADDAPVTPRSAQDPGESALWAIESLARLHEEEGDARAVVDVLVEGDALPFEPGTRRDMRRRAARVALDRLEDHERAVTLYLALLDDDPRDAEAVERLATIYQDQGRTRDLLDLRVRQVGASSSAEERVPLRLEAARLLVHLGDGVRAAETLRANLEEEPRHEATVEALATVLAAQDRARELLELLGDQARRAQQAGDAAQAVVLWSRAAEVAELRLKDARAAEDHHARAVEIEPRAASLDALARLAAARHDAASAAGWLERLLEVAPAEERVGAQLRLADALVEAGDGARAAERLEAALASSPESEAVRERLAKLYRGQGQWEQLAQLIAGSAGHAPDKPTRMARLLEAAQLYAGACAQPAMAIPLLEQASDLAPEDQAVRLALADALASGQRFDEARTLLQSMIDAFGGRRPKERAPVHYQIARLQLAMGNRARALVELDTATRVDPQNPEILRTLAELARDDGQLDRAEKSYRALLVVLRRREEAGEAPNVARSEVLLELSAIATRQEEGDRAREILESALEAAARSDFEHERLAAALRARGDHETLVRLIEARLARLGESPAAGAALAELADVLGERLGRPDEALPVRLRAVALDPRSAAAHEAALGLARAVGGVERYVDATNALVERAIAAGDGALARDLLGRIASVVEQELRDDARAAALYERAVELGLRDPVVLRALDHVYERLGDAVRQARVLAMRVEVEATEGGLRAANDAIYRLAALRLGSSETLDEGVRMLKDALDLDPRLDLAEQALSQALTIDAGHRAALDLYEHIGRQPGHEKTLFRALELRSRLPGSDVVRVREAVEVAVRLGEPALAESLLERFVEGEQTASQNVANLAWALGALASLREAAGDLRRAVELKRAAAKLADPEIARKLSFEVAHLAADSLGDFALAAETYETLRLADPADRDAWEPLAAAYRRLGEVRKLADLLAAVVEYVEDVHERGHLRLERVRSMREGLSLGDAEAAALLREIVDEDPAQVDAALMLVAILERTGAHEDLADLLARQMEAAKDRSDAASIASLALRLGGLLEQTDSIEARNVYYTGLDWEPRSRELLDALIRLLGTGGDAGERADLLERRLGAEQGPAAEDMALKLAATRIEMGDEAAAERALELGYRAHPASAVLRDRLEQAFRARQDWAKLADLCVLDASARVDTTERVERLREAAAIRRSELDDPRGAADALRLAHEASPEDASILGDLVEVLVQAGDPSGAVEQLTAAIEATSDDAARAGLLSVRAGVRAQAGEGSAALEDLEAAFVVDRATYATQLAEQLERTRAAAAEAGDATALHEVRLRLAQVLPYAGDVDGARATLGELTRQDPKDRAALRTLASLETALERWDAASAALRRLVGLEEGEEAVETALRLADACERAGRPADARGALERARIGAPEDAGVRERLERVYEQTGAWHELAELALQDARASGDVAKRFEQLLRAGTILLERAGDPGAAIVALEEARALRPADAECVGQLADAYTLSGRPQEALALLDPIVASQKGRRAKELAPLHLRLARVARYQGDAAGEVRSLVQALECDAQNGNVCSDVALRAIELDQLDLANRALRSVTLLKAPGPMSKALAYQYMGEIARKQSDPKRAVMLLKRALAEDPTLEGARALIDAIERGY
jgi:tetratricopeptide (TPR) repeat protein